MAYRRAFRAFWQLSKWAAWEIIPQPRTPILTGSGVFFIRFRTAFVGASGITDEAITVADYNEAQLKAAIIKRTQKVIVPMDRSKVGVVDFARVCEPRDIDIIVTDSANEDLMRICREHDIKLEEASI
jgi:DeoR/GlpR family transcriptional regulator of sugar metabolism